MCKESSINGLMPVKISHLEITDAVSEMMDKEREDETDNGAIE